MRITHGMMSENLLRNLDVNKERLDRLENELTSGQRITAPSDDPIGAAASVQFRSTLSELDQYIRNVDSATSWLEATESALDSITRILHRARELAVQGANGIYSSGDRKAMAIEVWQLLDQAVAMGNSTYTGQYIFGGFRVNAPPFAIALGPPASVTYDGDSGEIRRQLDNQSTVVVNLEGTALVNVFSTLIDLHGDLDSNDASAIASRVAEVDGAIEAVVSARSKAGARMNRLANQRDSLESLRVNVYDLLSKIQDADMAETITRFTVAQNVYQAALAGGAKAIQPSLLDYLR